MSSEGQGDRPGSQKDEHRQPHYRQSHHRDDGDGDPSSSVGWPSRHLNEPREGGRRYRAGQEQQRTREDVGARVVTGHLGPQVVTGEHDVQPSEEPERTKAEEGSSEVTSEQRDAPPRFATFASTTPE